MTTKRFFPTLGTLMLVILAACGGDGDNISDPVVNPLADLAGTWTATSFVLQPTDVPGLESLDLIAVGGSMRMDIRVSGEVVLTTTDPGGAGPEVSTGTIRVTSDLRLEILMPGDAPLLLDYALVGGGLSFSGRSTLDVEAYSGAADLTATFVRS